MWCPVKAVRPLRPLSPLWLLVALGLHAASPQLFDVRVPLVYEDPLKLSALRPTYFGFSVLLYSRNNYTWLQVGAPRSNCSNMPGISEPGRVYRCSPGKPCQLVLLDRTTNFDNGEYWDKKDGSWLGATMAVHATADKMVVCAPRWMNQIRETKNNRDWLMLGACYTSMASDPELLSASADKLVPLLATDYRYYTQKNWGTKFVYDYGMGQAGMSAYFTHERHDTQEVDKLNEGGKRAKAEQLQLVLGAPGVLNWRGSSVLLADHSLPSAVNRRRRDFFGNDGAFDSGVIPFTLDTKNARDGDYMGYSGVCGHFFSKGELLHVAGAPRGDTYMGKVYLYEFPARNRQAPKIRTFLRGDSAGSYFGAALGAADITGDGLDDLLVGAPYGLQPKVHVFLGNKWGALIVPPTGAKYLLMPQWGRFSRFGISIATADINQDGYSDVIVGAPEAEDGCGGVAVYLGSKTGLRETPHQTILAETIAPGLGMRGFGISIAPPVDIDANSLPDVAIGAYLSGHVVLLRARARAQLTATLIAEERLQRESKSLKIKACMLYFHKLQATQTITVSRVLTVDSAFGRAYMLGTLPSSFTYNHTRDLDADRESCQIIEIVIKPDVQNFQDPLEITLNVTLLESQEPNNPVIISDKGVTGMDAFNRMTPVIEVGQGTARINLPFSTNCGDDSICSSELVVNAHFPDHREGFVLGSTGSIVFEISLENRGEPAYVAQVRVTLMAPASLARLPAHCRADPDIICNMGNPLMLESPAKILRLEIDMRGVSDTSRAGEKLEFIVEALTKSDDKKENNLVIVPLVFKVDARVDIAGKSLQDTYSYSQLENSTSMGLVHFKHLYEVQKFGLSPVDEAELIVHLPYKYQHKGKEITFVQIYQPEGFQAGQPFYCQNMDNYTYAIDTEQHITLHEENYEEHGNSSNMHNSTSINNSSGIDNTMKIKVKRSIRRHNAEDYFNPLVGTVNSDELKSAVESCARVKREVQPEESLPANRTVRLSCAEPGVSCHTMRCVIGPFRRQQHVARLLITMALNITALKDTIMGVKDILVLGSDGLAAILGEEGKAVSVGSQAKVRSVFVSSPPEPQVELWIIAFSIILGMLLLLIVAMGLVKAGFFERKKKEELQALKEAEATQDAADTEEAWTEENQKEEEEVDFKVDER